MSARLFTQRTAAPLVDEPAMEPTSGVARRGREAGALLLFALSLFLCLALAGLRKDPAVPSLSGADWVGPVGAAVAGFLGQGFGLVAWLAPVEMLLIAIPMFRGRWHGTIGIRVAGDLVIAIVLAALVQVAFPEALVFGRLRGGGNVGLLFGELMRGLFSGVGSFLVGGTIVGLILIARSSFSFIGFCRTVIDFSQRALRTIGGWCARMLAAWREAWQLRRERREEQRAAAQPVITTESPDEAIIAKLEEEDESDWFLERPPEPVVTLSPTVRESKSGSAGLLVDSATTPAPPAGRPPVVSQRAHSDSSRSKQEDLAGGASAATPHAADSEHAGEPDDEKGAAGEPDADASVTADKPGRARRGKGSRGEADGPKIVDTRPAQEVRRSAEAGRHRRRSGFQLPSTEFLKASPPVIGTTDERRLKRNAERLVKTLADYKVSGVVREIHPGPTVTTYEVEPAPGTRVGRVAGLADDLALGLSSKVRIIAPIPGKNRIGFELPNDQRSTVYLRELVEDECFAQLAKKAPLPVVLGRDIVGHPFYADLASMPHLIVAGATGSGKSVGLNVMLTSLLLYRTPEDMRLLMIDPKVVELAPYDNIPHMLLPVVTDMKQAATALRWAVDEMERRYQLFYEAGTKSIVTYNKWVKRVARGEIELPPPSSVSALAADGAVVSVPAAKEGSDGVQLPGRLPYIVVVVDEFSDLMMQGGKDVEASVARLAQKARAAGIHVVLATQRPSVDVITGMIKANFPSRIAYRVAQKVDSRTILDDQGAEWLLGRGDMLVKTNGGDTRRVQCPFIDEDEVSALTDYLRTQGQPEYHEAILAGADEDEAKEGADEKIDPLYDKAVQVVADTQRCSTSWLQRKLTIGYNRAAKIVEMMEKRGVVGPPNGARDREVLVSPL